MMDVDVRMRLGGDYLGAVSGKTYLHVSNDVLIYDYIIIQAPPYAGILT